MRLLSYLAARSASDDAKVAHALREVALFRDLPGRDLAKLWRAIEAAPVDAGTVICRRGDPGDCFFVVHAGQIEVRLGLGPAGVPIRRLHAGDSFGEMALLTGRPRSADVVAVQDSELWQLRKRDFDALTRTSVAVNRGLNRALCALVEDLTLKLEARPAPERAAPEGLRFGPYRVVEQIGSGGMAVVYACVHAETETAAAVKVLPASWGSAPELQERLAREAALLQRLHHPNIVRVLETGTVDAALGGGTYLAMEWLPNALDRVLHAHYPQPLPVATALRLSLGIALGLTAAHAAGIVHRDVKPSNVLLRADGTPVLTDFGLATLCAETAAQRQLTPLNTVIGTADYMSPEQVRGDALDGRSDLYSLGIVLYQMLSGLVPFAGRTPTETLRAQVEQQVPPLPSYVPLAARRVVQRVLCKRPEDRFSAAMEMARAIEAALAETGGAPARPAAS